MSTPPAAACSARTPSIAPLASAPCSSRNIANAAWPLTIEYGSTWVPSLPFSLTLTPAAISSFAISMSPLRAANISGVNPLLDEACTSAPPSTSTLAISGWGSATAHISAVLLVSVVAALTFGAAGEQRLDDLEVAGVRRDHQRRHAARLREVRVGAGLQQPLDHPGAGVFGRARERRDAVVVGGVDLGARLEQQVDRLEIVPVGGQQERRGAVGPRRVHVDALLEQRPDGRLVLVGRGRDEPQIGIGGHGPRRRSRARRPSAVTVRRVRRMPIVPPLITIRLAAHDSHFSERRRDEVLRVKQ